MFWNHRVIEHTDPNGAKVYGIHEVYYDNDGNLQAYTEDAVGITWDEGEDPMEIVERMVACMRKPVLKASDFPEPEKLDWGTPEEMERFSDSMEGLIRAIKDLKSDEA
jgi:hypothetical protein